MITHEEARENALFLQNDYDMAYDELLDYISQQEAIQAEHEALKKDVARYFEDRNRFENTLVSDEELAEFWKLEEKLSKVGKKE